MTIAVIAGLVACAVAALVNAHFDDRARRARAALASIDEHRRMCAALAPGRETRAEAPALARRTTAF